MSLFLYKTLINLHGKCAFIYIIHFYLTLIKKAQIILEFCGGYMVMNKKT